MDKNLKGFLLVSSIFASMILLVMAFFIWTLYSGSFEVYEFLIMGSLFGMAFILLAFLVSFLSMLLVYFKKVRKGIIAKFASFGLKSFFKLFEIFANLLRLDKNKIRGFYIDINNSIVSSKNYRVGKDKILIILPHCVQNSLCDIKVTGDISLCKKCGKCDIKGCLDICEEYGLKAIVATGGTLARKAVKENKPSFIISVACERDLAAGISDVSGIPVIGILNQRPNGPCFNTRFDVEFLRAQIKKALDGEG